MKNFKASELSIIFIVLTVLVLFVVPTPPVLVDFFILVNILATIILMSLVIYVDSMVKLSFFPSILLILTLFRIGLSVSTARLILLTGTAGGFIETAGKVLIGDNLVVGVLIFIIIAVVNFLVVTKGSERVAEVVARFTLDAMPGKQMSIDADLKAGNITMEEAQERRSILQTENSLYGALDGATKFVKGDVISNIIIVTVNLVAGIIIGVYQMDMDMPQAVSTYSMLSIGDGLLQQIPITLSSLASGIIVTRINSNLTSGSIGGSIRNTLAENKIIFLICAALLPGVLFVQEISKPMVIGMFLMFIFLFYKIKPAETKKEQEAGGSKQNITDVSSSAVNKDADSPLTSNLPAIDAWKVYPILVVLSEDLVRSKKNKLIKTALESVNTNLFAKLGIELPKIFITTSGQLSSSSYQILINEVLVDSFTLYEDMMLVTDSLISSVIDESKLVPNTIDIGYPELGYWVEESVIKEINLPEGLMVLSIDKVIVEHLTNVLVNNISELIGFQEVKALLDKMTDYQDLIKELLRMIPLNKLSDIIKRLLVERIPIRNFKVILDALLEWGSKESETILLVEYVRLSLAKYIVQLYKYEEQVFAICIDSELEAQISNAVRYTNNGMYLDLDDEFYESFHENLSQIFLSFKMKGKLVVVTKLDIRKAVSSIVSRSFKIPVLSYEEVDAAKVEVNPVDFIY